MNTIHLIFSQARTTLSHPQTTPNSGFFFPIIAGVWLGFPVLEAKKPTIPVTFARSSTGLPATRPTDQSQHVSSAAEAFSVSAGAKHVYSQMRYSYSFHFSGKVEKR